MTDERGFEELVSDYNEAVALYREVVKESARVCGCCGATSVFLDTPEVECVEAFAMQRAEELAASGWPFLGYLAGWDKMLYLAMTNVRGRK